MNLRFKFVLAGILLLSLSILAGKQYNNAYLIDFNDKPLLRKASQSNSSFRIYGKELDLGSSYLLHFRGEVGDSGNLKVYKLPFIVKALPDISGNFDIKERIGAKESANSFKFSSGIFNRVARNFNVTGNASIQIQALLSQFSFKTSEDYIDVSVSTKKGSFISYTLEVYEDRGFFSSLKFFPLISLYTMFASGLAGVGFFVLSIFGPPSSFGFYHFLFKVLFGLIGLDSFVEERYSFFIVRFFSMSLFGLYYIFDISRTFFILLQSSYRKL